MTVLPTLASLLLLLPFVAANFNNGGIHKLKLHKLPPTTSNLALETAYLAEKYRGRADILDQAPFMGSGGPRRNARVNVPSYSDDGLSWIQDGHSVPLTSTCQARSHENID